MHFYLFIGMLLLLCECDIRPEIQYENIPRIVATSASQGDVNPVTVSLDQPITVDFDQLLSPRFVNDQTFQLRSGELGVFLRVRYEPTRHRAVIVPFPGQMLPHLEYIFTVGPGVVGWQGASNQEQRQFRLRTTTERYVAPTHQIVFSTEILPIFTQNCAFSGCHSGREPVMGLDLSTAQGVVSTAVGVLARQRDNGSGTGSQRTDPQWGTMFRIDRGEVGPGYSYLLYKLLGDGPINGARMPLDRAPLSQQQIQTIEQWIIQGAQTSE